MTNSKSLPSKIFAEIRRFGRRRRFKAELAQIQARLDETLRDRPRLAVRVSGGIGDQIVAARYLRDLLTQIEPMPIDLFLSNAVVGKWAFGPIANVEAVHNYDYIWERLKKSYPISLDIAQFVVPEIAASDAAVAASRHSALLEICGRAGKFVQENKALVENHPYLDNALGRLMAFSGYSRRDALQGMTGIPYGGDRLDIEVDPKVFARTGLVPGDYVTIHNGFDPGFTGRTATSTKVYPHYAGLVARMKQARPDLKIVQIGVETSVPIDGVDLLLINKTSLKEAAALLGGSRLHIDNEGGLVHIASCLGAKCCVLFGPTSLEYFGYPDNLNIPPATCGDCWWIKKSWMNECIRGFDPPVCLHGTEPADVFRRIEPYLAAPTPDFRLAAFASRR